MADNLWKRSLEESGASETDRIARLACGDLAYLASQTRNLFAPVAGGERFKSPYVAMGSTGSRDGAGVVRRMDYPKHSALGFLCTWREEYLERPCDRLATDARGGLCLPLFDRGALANYSTQNPGKNPAATGAAAAASIDALSAHLCREMAARGGGKAWAPIDGCWRWDFDLDAGDEAPCWDLRSVDAALGGDARPGASAATELAAARRAVLGDDVEDARVADAELGKAAASKNGNEEEKKEEEEEEKKEEEEERVALGAAETDADAVAAEPTLPIPERSRRSPRVVTSPPVNRWGEPEPDVPCVVCGDVGDATDFILCDGCPSGGHVDCLNLPANPSHFRVTGPSRHTRATTGSATRARGVSSRGSSPRAAAALRSPPPTEPRWNEPGSGAHGGVATVSAVPGATGAVPSVGPVAAHNLAEYHPVHLTTNCEVVALPGDPPPPPPTMPLTSSGGNKRAFWEGNATLGDDGKPTKAAAEAIAKRRRVGGGGPGSFAPFPMPRDCPLGVIVECGGAWGEFRVLEGLVHCMCAGCEFGIAYGLQPTNVFGLQSFEFHGGKGSAGKWKASIRAHPDGLPDEYFAQVDVQLAAGDDAPLAAAVTAAAGRGDREDRRGIPARAWGRGWSGSAPSIRAWRAAGTRKPRDATRAALKIFLTTTKTGLASALRSIQANAPPFHSRRPPGVLRPGVWEASAIAPGRRRRPRR